MFCCKSSTSRCASEDSCKIHRQRSTLPWIASPVDEKDGDPPHLYHHSDATPIELFFDLFFVANLSTFTATHEINNVKGEFLAVSF